MCSKSTILLWAGEWMGLAPPKAGGMTVNNATDMAKGALANLVKRTNLPAGSITALHLGGG